MRVANLVGIQEWADLEGCRDRSVEVLYHKNCHLSSKRQWRQDTLKEVLKVVGWLVGWLAVLYLV